MSDAIRAADADREAVATTLRRAHEEGRLDTLELEDRLTRCYAAKTLAELDRLVADLPHAERPAPRVSHGRRPPLVLVPLALLAVGAAMVASHGHAFFLFPLLFFVFLRFGRGWGGKGRVSPTRR
jgi:Domain of unknown function (DUF1707)